MTKKTMLLIAILATSLLHAMSQQQAEIRTVFDKYGKQQGVVLVQLSHDILSQGSNLSLYKSMVIKDIEKSEKEELLTELLSNKRDWKIIVEMKQNGRVESGAYHIGKDQTEKLNTYLLLKNKDDKITILYIEGNFAPQRLDEELKKLKDLFIYVNNKKVKLY